MNFFWLCFFLNSIQSHKFSLVHCLDLQQLLFFLILKFSVLSSEDNLKLVLVSLCHNSITYSRWLHSLALRFPQAHLVFPCHKPGTSHFLKDIWFLLMGSKIRNQTLDTGGAPFYQGVIPLPLFQWTELEDMCFLNNEFVMIFSILTLQCFT